MSQHDASNDPEKSQDVALLTGDTNTTSCVGSEAPTGQALIPPHLRLGDVERDIPLNLPGYAPDAQGWGAFFDTTHLDAARRETYRRAFRKLHAAHFVTFGYEWTTAAGPGRGRGHQRNGNGEHLCSRRHYRLTPLGQLIVNMTRAPLQSGERIRWTPVRAHIDALPDNVKTFIAAASMAPSGMSMPQIAAKMGLSVTTIYRDLTPIKPNGRPNT